VNEGRLRVSNLALEDSGMYQCVAENKHGNIYANGELRVQGEGLTTRESSEDVLLFSPR